MSTLLFAIAGLLFLLLGPPLLLKTSCAVCGESSPGFFQAVGISLAAGFVSLLVGAAYGCTFGVFISMFSAWVAGALNVLVTLLSAATVYSAMMRIAFPNALRVAFVYYGISAITGALWYYLIWNPIW